MRGRQAPLAVLAVEVFGLIGYHLRRRTMRRFLLPNNNVITEKALRDFYARVREIISNRDQSDGISVMEQTLSALEKFFTRLGKPQFEHKEILPEDPIISDELNAILGTIVNDLKVGYEEVANLRDSAIATHNYATMHIGEIQRRSDEVAGLVTDLRLVSGQHGEEVIVFSDNFVDDSKLDAGFPLEHLPAQTMPGQGSLTLNRTEVRALASEEIECSVTPLNGASRDPSVDNVGRFYEGHFYAYLGEAEPEGGKFHLEEKLNQSTLTGLDQSAFQIPKMEGKGKKARKAYQRELADFVVPGGAEAQFLEELKSGLFNDRFANTKKGKAKFNKFVRNQRKVLHRKDRILRRQFMYFANNPEEAERASFDLNTDDVPLTAENFTLVENGATEEELGAYRLNMLDGNPGSYWQCELVRATNIIQDFVNSQVAEVTNAEVKASDLRDLASSNAVDKEDFEVEIVFTFARPVSMNWITLTPMLFDDGAYLEVTDVSTAPDLESEFIQVDTFATRQYANILTEEANEELPKETASYLLAPSRYSYRGSGIWPFVQRTVQKVRFRVKQRTPVPNPYERFVFEATRTLTARTRRRVQ